MPDTPDPLDLATTPTSSSARAPDHPSNRPRVDTLETLFTYHPPTGDQNKRYMLLRVSARSFATTILTCCSPSADTSAAVRKVREALMTANAAIALEPPA